MVDKADVAVERNVVALGDRGAVVVVILNAVTLVVVAVEVPILAYWVLFSH